MRNLKIKQIKEEAQEVSKASIIALEKIYTAFIEFVNPKGFFKKAALMTFLFLFLNMSSTMPGGSTDSSAQVTPAKSEEQLYVESVKEKMRSRLIEEVGIYIERMAPTSKLTPGHLVDKCLQYDVDIIFVLSQGLLESHFGTKGLAAKTNSVWNVGAFDNQRPKNKFWYKTQDESLEPYLKLIKEDYLMAVTHAGDTIHKDIHDLVIKSYTNYAGKRFASARGYENAMRKMMINIDMETSISFYQDLLKMPQTQILAYFKPGYDDLNADVFYALK